MRRWTVGRGWCWADAEIGWESARVKNMEVAIIERSMVMVCDSAMSAKSMVVSVRWRGVGY